MYSRRGDETVHGCHSESAVLQDFLHEQTPNGQCGVGSLALGHLFEMDLSVFGSDPYSGGKVRCVPDEPSVGLHWYDLDKLIKIINKLADAGNTILIIEHNMDLIKIADHIIDLGPEGGDAGGNIVFEGTPEEIVKCKKSYTGQYLKSYLS